MEPTAGPSRGNAHCHVLATLPVHNEACRLRASVVRLRNALRDAGISFTLAIAEDGSTDGTKEVLEQLRREMPDLVIQEGGAKWGRGRAIRELWSRYSADIYCFTDTDLAMGTAPLIDSIRLVEGGADLVVGSRYVDGAKVVRPYLRSVASRAYNWAVRRGFHEGIRDHQCGLKTFSRQTYRRLGAVAREDSWFWDTEILVLATALGISVQEIPVDWRESKYARTSFRRLMSDVYLHGSGLLRLRGQIARVRERSLVTGSVGGWKTPTAREPGH